MGSVNNVRPQYGAGAPIVGAALKPDIEKKQTFTATQVGSTSRIGNTSLENSPKSDNFQHNNALVPNAKTPSDTKAGTSGSITVGSTPVSNVPGDNPFTKNLSGDAIPRSPTANAKDSKSLLPITKDDQKGTDEINKALTQIANDPDGQKLLKLAKNKGYHIEITESQNGAATTYRDSKTIVVDLNAKGLDAYNLTAIVAHELVHAATDDNGNSFMEEVTATTLANHIAKRAEGKKETPEEVSNEFKRIYADYKNASSPTLKFLYEKLKDNDIRDDLGSIGIDVSNYVGPAIPDLQIQQVTFDQFDAAITGETDRKISLSDIQKMKTGNGSNALLAKILEKNFGDIAGTDKMIDIYDLNVIRE